MKNLSSKKSRQGKYVPFIALAVVGSLTLFYFIFSVSMLYFVRELTKTFFIPHITQTEEMLCDFRSQLNGSCVSERFRQAKQYSVIIDNSFDARPIYGLEDADIVYETLSESGITRYVAIYDSSRRPKKIGPVRSARPYFIDFAREWDSVFFHSGGSPEALFILKNDDTKNINEISGDGIYFYRDPSVNAPHNLFITGISAEKAVQKKGFEASDFEAWKFKEDKDARLRPKTSEDLVVSFSGPLYRVVWQYNKKENNYIRFLNDEQHFSGDGDFIYAKNVIAQVVDSEVVDSAGRRKVTLTGKGLAYLHLDNERYEGYWQTKKRRTRFYKNTGEEVEFNRGKIWIEVVSE